MAEDLVSTLRFVADATGVSTTMTSVKREISDLGAKVAAVSKGTNDALAGIGKGDKLSPAIAKATKAVIRDIGDLTKQITLAGSDVAKGFHGIGKSAEEAYVSLAGKSVPDTYIQTYIGLLKRAQDIQRESASKAAAAAAAESAAIQQVIAVEEHYSTLKAQHAAYNKAQADQAAASLREELALVNQINDASLGLKHTGKASKPSAYYEEKAGPLAASPKVSTALTDLKAQEAAIRDAAKASEELSNTQQLQKLKLIELNGRIAASNKAASDAIANQAAKEITDTKNRAAALTAYYTEVQNAELNMTHTGRGKSSAMLIDKGQRLGFTPEEINTAVAGLSKVEAAQKAAFAAANPNIEKLRLQAEAAGTSVKGLSASMRNVPAQFTDIIVSLQGGQAPLTVLLQQGGQLKDMFGGVGNATRALGGYIMWLVNPYTLAAGAAGLLAMAYLEGAKEAEAYNKALITTGNYAGTTSAQLSDMAQSVAKSTSATVGTAADALAQLAGAGSIPSEQFEMIAKAAVSMNKATGVSISDTVKQFAELGKEPLTASLKLNESTHFLTLSVYEQIKALMEQGRATEAATVAQKGLADSIEERTPKLIENLGFLEFAWKQVASATKQAADFAKEVGRDGPTGLALITEQIQAIEQLNAPGRGMFSGLSDGQKQELDRLKGLKDYYQALEDTKAKSAKEDAKRAKEVERQSAFDKATSQNPQKSEKLTKGISALSGKFEDVAKTPENIKAYVQAVKDLQEANKPEKARKGPSNFDPDAIAKAQLAKDLVMINTEAAAKSNAYANANKIMEAMRSAGLVSDGEYYAQKRAELEANSAIQEASLAADITRLEKEQLVGKNRIEIETKLIEARSKLKIAKASNSNSATLLDMSEEASKKAQDKFFTDAVDASDGRINAQVEAIRAAGLSALDAENEAYAARIKLLKEYNARKAEDVASANYLIEDENRRHEQALFDLKMKGDAQSLSLMASTADQIFAVLKRSGAEQTALGKAVYLAQKAMAVAQIIMQTEVAAAAAVKDGAMFSIFGIPTGIAMASMIRGMGYASAGMVAGLAIAEASAEGGYDIPDGKNPIVQTHAKEMILPRAQANVIRDLAKDSGIGKSGNAPITIINQTSGRIDKVTEQTLSNGERALIIQEAVNATASQMSDPNSRTSRSMSRNFAMSRSR